MTNERFFNLYPECKLAMSARPPLNHGEAVRANWTKVLSSNAREYSRTAAQSPKAAQGRIFAVAVWRQSEELPPKYPIPLLAKVFSRGRAGLQGSKIFPQRAWRARNALPSVA